MKYRREIDGLRSIAILPVVFYHANNFWMPNGYLGVDVFFVISGYLISSILLRHIHNNAFSFQTFYFRRAMRLLPALFVMMMTCFIVGWLVLLPRELTELCKSIVSTIMISSNFYFMRQRGYFDPRVEMEPLMHTWSLSIEEQFYLVLPLLLVALRKQAISKQLRVFAYAAALSLAIYVMGGILFQAINFYFSIARFWELLTGVICAYLHFVHVPQASNMWSGLGLLGIFLALSGGGLNPEVAKLVTVLGTAAVLLYGQHETFAGRILSGSLPVSIGLVSYSLYLWHQPILAFARVLNNENLSTTFLLFLITASLLIAVLSHRCIEKPFRYGLHLPNYRNVQRGTLLMAFSLVLLSLGFAGYGTRGFPKRAWALHVTAGHIEDKLRGRADVFRAMRNTLQPPMFASSRTLIWGDSIGEQWVIGNRDSPCAIFVENATRSSCIPELVSNQSDSSCHGHNRNVEKRVYTEHFDRLILSSTFEGIFSPLRSEGRGNAHLARELANHYWQTTLEPLRKHVRSLVVIAPPPRARATNLGSCLKNAVLYGKDLSICDFTPAQWDPQTQDAYAFLRELEQMGTHVVWMHKRLCAGGICKTHDGDRFLYRDKRHLTIYGAIDAVTNTPELNCAIEQNVVFPDKMSSIQTQWPTPTIDRLQAAQH